MTLEPPDSLQWKWKGSRQTCPTLCDPKDCSPPGSSIHGILQARILEWVPISFSRGSSRPRDWTRVSHTADRLFTIWATGKPYSLQTGRQRKLPQPHLQWEVEANILPGPVRFLSWPSTSQSSVHLTSSSFFFLKTALVVRGLLCFHTNCEFFCSSSVKNTNPRTWCISPSVCVIFDFFHQCLIVSCIQAFCLFLGILFFLLQWGMGLFHNNFSFWVFIVIVEESKGFLGMNFIFCNFTIFID